jgi:hypothetical protein
MRKTLAIILCAAAALSTASAAYASGGCGVAFHRGPGGRCLPNGGPVIGVPGLAIGIGRIGTRGTAVGATVKRGRMRRRE